MIDFCITSICYLNFDFRNQKFAEEIRPCVTDTVYFLNKSIKEGKAILIEGANATMLDIDFGIKCFYTIETQL